jgi:hypothetical protein
VKNSSEALLLRRMVGKIIKNRKKLIRIGENKEQKNRQKEK